MSSSSVASLHTNPVSETSSHRHDHYHNHASTSSHKVIIVGSGLAGLSASTELISRDIPVHILERQTKPGGNSIKASSGINGVPTRFQIPGSDSIEEFYGDTLKSAGERPDTGEAREKLISTLTYSSQAAINWLVDEQGIDLEKVALLGGHSKARTHRGAGNTPPGASIVLTLLKKLKESPLVTLETGVTVTQVLKREERVVGVKVKRAAGEADPEETATIDGPVIFASGGFAGDSKGYLKEFRPDLAGFPSTNEALPGSQGLLVDVGAQLLDMGEVQVHPTGFIDPNDRFKATKFLAAEVLRGEGGIMLNSEGKRFINELQTRKVVTDTITQTISPSNNEPLKQWDISLVLDEGVYEAAKSHVDFYIWKGLIKKTTIGDLGDASATALETIKRYAATAQSSTTSPDLYDRTSFGHWSLQNPTPESTIYVGTVTPVVHYTMGGVVFNPEAEVLNARNRPIAGLWAAGEITGGLHGANRLGGSSLLECVVFGRIAAANAARYVEDRDRDTPIEDGDCCWESR
ncbi:aromatic-L-amino-acid decarboxylase [Exophiala aquamarina CBS 119918]|uniref:Fumarate reductase n=1 Tax=Exophiala aquamarina CBS 119918 TaxID=1182545 RepID=A0A072PII9_9EURO|nr:aromatic-L-amino-acid decarboxylase [Exophiala aquamarina CBS 119918]KEF59686.1 aromatic-L-amino-acid decarboxylase [Exophiala aquamarina CBS 119918]